MSSNPNPDQEQVELQALYFDGRLAKGTQVKVRKQAGQLLIVFHEGRHSVELGKIRRLESLGNAPIVIELPNGASLEFSRACGMDILKSWGVLSLNWFERLQYHPTHWLLVSLACFLLAAGLYAQGLPLASKWIAAALPPDQMSKWFGDVLPKLDGILFEPSKLEAEAQAVHHAELSKLINHKETLSHVRLVFRSSKIGPNAFALPDGTIVLTDELVEALPPQAIAGVLAHELGHIELRHATRRLIQSAVGSTLIFLFTGDVSILATLLTTQLVEQHYSRDFEREADLFAIEMFVGQGSDLASLELLHERMGKLTAQDNPGLAYLSSHPGAEERLELIRAYRKKFPVLEYQ